jgi:PAS domain S-box-containing protein
MTGYDKEEILNIPFIDLCPTKQPDGKLSKTLLSKAFKNSAYTHEELNNWKFNTRNSKELFCHIIVSTVFVEGVDYVVLEIEELLASKNIAQRLKEKNKQIESLSEERESLNEELRATLDELVEVNKQLADSEFWNKTIVENIPLGLQVVNESEAEYINKKLTEITGYSPDFFRTKTIFDLGTEEEKIRIREFLDQIKKDGLNEAMIEFWINTAAGEKRYFRNQFVRLNKESRWMVITSDLSENKAKENDLITIQQQLEFAIESIQSLIWDISLSPEGEDKVISIGRIFDYESGELNITKNIWKEIVHPEDYPKVAEEFDKHFKGETQLLETEGRIKTKSGNYKWALIRGKIKQIYYPQPSQHFIGMLVDISKRKETEEQLAFSEEKFRTIVQHLSDLILIVDRDLSIIYESPSVSKTFGYEPGYLLGKNAMDIIHPSDKELAIREFSNVLEKKNDFRPTELRSRHANGYWVYLEVLGDDLSDYPAIGGILITARDISERKENELQLSLYRDHLEQLVKKRTEEIERINAELIAINEELTATNEELAIKNEKLNDEIVKRIEAQIALEESENKFRSFIEQSTEGIILIDEEGKIVDWNKGMEMIFKIPREEVINTYVWEFDYRFLPEMRKTPEQFEKLKNSTIEYFSRLNHSQIMTVEDYFQTIELKQKYLTVTIFPVITPKRRYLGRIIRDITGIKKAQEEIQKQSEELQIINENLEQQKYELEKTLAELKKTQAQLIHSEKMASLGVLTAGVAHEINNPVNYINAALEGLKVTLSDFLDIYYQYETINVENVDSKLKEIQNLKEQLDFPTLQQGINVLLNNMQTGIERITEIVKSLRTFARVEENELKFSNVHELIDTTLVMLHNQYKNRIEIVKDYGFVTSINCYPGKLSQVFMNILSNAIQAIPDKGTITISTSTDKGGKFFIISIKDTGVGIPDDIKEKIFEPFYTTKEAGKGTGLGLSITYGIIQQHNGTIEINSKVGEGTEFIIKIPTNLS